MKKQHLSESRVGDEVLLTVIDELGNSKFSFFPRLGACLNELILNGQSILRSVTSVDYKERLYQEYNGAQLFPFPNRLEGGIYTWNNKEYSFDQNDFDRPNALHGILLNASFQVLESNSKGGVITSHSYRKDHDGYPFNIDIKNVFSIDGDSFKAVSIFENVGEEDALIGHGWHPYFSAPRGLENYSLKLDTAKTLEVDKNLIPTGNSTVTTEFVDGKSLESEQLDCCFVTNDRPLELLNKSNGSKIILSTKGYPYTQIFIPPNRDCIAIEPQTCAPNSFNNKLGLINLGSRMRIELSFEIKMEF